MNKNIFKTLTAATFLFGTSLLTTACDDNDEVVNEIVPVPEAKPETGLYSIPYTVSVSKSDATRATIDPSDLSLYFQDGDMLYVEAKEWDQSNSKLINVCVGNLQLKSGIGYQSAVFEGNLYFSNKIVDESELSNFTNATYFLIGPYDKRYDGKWTLFNDTNSYVEWLTSWVDYNNNLIVPTLEDAVQQYSDIKCESNNGLIGYNENAPSIVVLEQKATYFKVSIGCFETAYANKTLTSITAQFLNSESTSALTATNNATNIQFKKTSDGHVNIEFVASIDVPTESIKDIQFDFDFSDGTNKRVRINKNSAKEIVHGKIYNIDELEEGNNNQITSTSAIGAIGYLDGRQAIVVDLGDNQKVAIALENSRDLVSWEGANTLSNPTGWRLPTKDEYVRLNFLSHSVETKEGIEGVNWSWTFGNHSTSLFLPFKGYVLSSTGENFSENGYYWTSSQVNTSNYYAAKFSNIEANPFQSISEAKDNLLSVRLFHTLE